MLKRIGLPVLALTAMLVLVPVPKASAGVRVGVVVGTPVYTYPAYPYPTYPYNYAGYNAYPACTYPTPAYGYSYGYWRDHARGRREHECREHEWHEYERHEHEGWGRGYHR
jgi:hypothetical protein